MQRILTVATLLVALLLGLAASAYSQVTYDPNKEKYALLALNQAFVNLGRAAKDFIRSKEQFDAKLISEKDYETSLNSYQKVKLDYDTALMNILNNTANVIVEKAVKKVRTDGTKYVEIVVKNEIGGSFELSKLAAFGVRDSDMLGGKKEAGSDASMKQVSSEDFSETEKVIAATLPYIEAQGLAFKDVLNLLELNNIFITLKSKTATGQDVMISYPYEQKIAQLSENERATVRFDLLRDVESVDVEIRFGDKTITKPVYLRLESTAGGIEVDSQIPNLQADLDSTATFNLNLQRFSSGSTAFGLRVVDLPEQIDFNFIDPDNNNQQVTRVNFTEGTVKKNIQLQLTMPTRKSDKVQVDQSISFKALVLSDIEVKKFDELRNEYGRYIPAEKLEGLSAGVVDLVVTPQGVGRVEVSASTFYYPIQPDEKVEMVITVKNTGTGELKNVQIETDLPNNEWNYTIEPKLIALLNPEGEEKVKLTFEPPLDATEGEHILKVKVEAKTRNRIIEADDKEVTVEIKAKPDIWGRLILVVLLIGIVLGIVIFGIKLSRR